jgi:prepilin-type N-terminal cleavage/methylation domain-containing protein/prepilin-type processing-associated H-X9-DG protein
MEAGVWFGIIPLCMPQTLNFPTEASPFFRTSRLSGRQAFTLIEMLAAIAIVVILAALLFPMAKNSSNKALGTKCQAILRQFAIAAEQYSADNNGISLPAVVYTSPTGGNNWPALLRPYLGAADLYDKSLDSRFTCPSMPKTSLNAWAWGYGINCRPGYNGPSTIYPDNRLSYQNSTNPWFAPFQSLMISDKSKRALFVDGDNWQIDPSLPVQNSGAALNRHGKDRCTVVYFDGHAESLPQNKVYMALYEPAKL